MLRLIEGSHNNTDGYNKAQDMMVAYDIACNILNQRDSARIKKRNIIINEYLKKRLAGEANFQFNAALMKIIDQDEILVIKAIETLAKDMEDHSEVIELNLISYPTTFATEVT